MALPVWGFIVVCFLEMVLLAGWMQNQLTFEFLASRFSVGLAMFLVLFGIVEIQILGRQRSRRFIQFAEKKILLKPCKSGAILWKRVAKFQFEPILGTPGLTKLKLYLHGFPNQKPCSHVFWQMVLEHPAEVQSLVHFLQTKKSESATNFEIETLDRAAPPEPATAFPFLGMSLYFGGLYLLLHGLTSLGVALESEHRRPPGGPTFVPAESDRLGHFLVSHFSSPEEFKHFLMVSSIGLIVAGLTLLFLGWRLMKRKTPASLSPAKA